MKRLVLEKRPRRPRHASASFRPAFLDFSTMEIHLSRFEDGRLAPVHIAACLPAALLAKGTFVAGFEREGFFYSRRAVARACEEWRL